MENIYIWLIIILTSIFFGIVSYTAGNYNSTNQKNLCFKFLEVWRHCVNYLITGIIVYYFVSVRWSSVSGGANLLISDFILVFIFFIGIFGWLPYFIKYITEGIAIIFQKIFNK